MIPGPLPAARRPTVELTGARAEVVKRAGRPGVRFNEWLGRVPARKASDMAMAIFIGTGLTVANFAWQALGGQHWDTALERSWFQFTACLAMALGEYALRRSVGAP